MFLVFNKEKIYAYIVSVLTVVALFFIASTTVENVVETSSNTNTVYNIYENSTNTIDTNNIVK